MGLGLSMSSQKRNRSLLVVVLWASLLGGLGGFAEEAKPKPLTVDEAKFEMTNLYLEAKLNGGSLKPKYPALRKADKLAREARRAYSNAITNAPELKAEFDRIDQLKISIPEKLKLQKPLFAKAETLSSLDEVRMAYNKARVLSLTEEVKAIRSEGHEDLANGLAKILGRVKKP